MRRQTSLDQKEMLFKAASMPQKVVVSVAGGEVAVGDAARPRKKAKVTARLRKEKKGTIRNRNGPGDAHMDMVEVMVVISRDLSFIDATRGR